MIKKLLTLSIITALSACGSSDDNSNSEPTAATFSGDTSAVLSKYEYDPLRVTVQDVNAGESLIFPDTIEGTYGTFKINAAGDWDYELFTGEDEHPEITALVSSDLPSLTEVPFTIRSADGSTQQVLITIEGRDVPAVFTGTINTSVGINTGSISAKTSVLDDNPAEAAYLPVLEQLGAEATEVEGEVKVNTTYGTVTFTISEFIPAVEAVEAVPEVPADPETGTPAIPAIPAVKGKAAVPSQVSWTYQIDVNNPDIQAHYYTDTASIPEPLMDSFTLTSLDGTTIDILISVRSSEQVPAEITGVPDAVEVEPVEGEEPVPNASAEVNINAANVSGMLSITDPNLMEETFVAVEDIATSYGQFSIDESGEWSYTLNTELEVIKAHKGDGVAPDPLMDVATVTSFDGTQVDVPITINGLVGGNLTAEIGGGTADSLFRINMPEGQTLRTGKMTLKVNYAESGTRDAKVIFFGRAFNSDDKRTLAALSMRANGELKLMDGAGSRATFTLDQTHTPGEWFDIAFTWDATPETKNGGKTVISLSINGTPITSSGGQISGEFFESLSIAKFIVDIGMKHMQVSTKGNSGPVNVDDYVIYSDVAGTTEIYNQSFDELGEGAAISLDLRNGATKGTIVGPLAKP